MVWYEQGGTTSRQRPDARQRDGVRRQGRRRRRRRRRQLQVGGGRQHATARRSTPPGTNHFGGCAASDAAEEGCSLNKNPNVDAEDPRVAAGTMNPANPTVPWVAWDEDARTASSRSSSRGSSAAPHFELVNNGAPISVGANDSTRPDITFSGNTPYVTWREDTGGGVEKAFVGHFVNAGEPDVRARRERRAADAVDHGRRT